jgi:hypothetical protein
MEAAPTPPPPGPRPKGPSDNKNYKKTEDGKSRQVTLAKDTCESFFALRYLLSNTSGKPVSKGRVVDWLLQQAKGGIEALHKHLASMSAGGRVGHATTTEGASTPAASSKWPVPQTLFDASPGRLAVLGKREIDWDEMLGYIAMEDFDNDRIFKKFSQRKFHQKDLLEGVLL